MLIFGEGSVARLYYPNGNLFARGIYIYTLYAPRYFLSLKLLSTICFIAEQFILRMMPYGPSLLYLVLAPLSAHLFWICLYFCAWRNGLPGMVKIGVTEHLHSLFFLKFFSFVFGHIRGWIGRYRSIATAFFICL